MSNPFVIFDRDGTLIRHIHHLSDPNKVELTPNLIPGLLLLRNNGFKFGIVTNQSVINRGLATVQDVESVNEKVINLLRVAGLRLEFVSYCPHSPKELCSCRKPQLDLGLAAIQKHKIDKERSFMVGDQLSDVMFGHSLGLKSIQVGGGLKTSYIADYVADDILSAATWIISKLEK